MRVRQFSRLVTAVVALLAFNGPAAALGAGDKTKIGTGASSSKNPFAADAKAIAEGQDLFGRNCQQCHSTRGMGGKCPQLVHGAWAPDGANSDEFMFRVIKKGRPNTQMGAFEGGLSDDEIWKIVAYLRYEAKAYEELKKLKRGDDEDDSRR